MIQNEIVRDVTWGTEFRDPTLPERLEHNAELGFLAVQGSEVGGGITILGYSPLADGEHLPYITSSVTELEFLPEAERTIDRQGKGVGRRLYVSPHAVAGLAWRTDHVAAFTTNITVAEMLDMRAASDATLVGSVQRIARHAGRIVRSGAQDLTTVTDAIHDSYGAAQTVRFSQPPRARLRERMRRVGQPIPSGFLIVRDPKIPLYGVGVRRSLVPSG